MPRGRARGPQRMRSAAPWPALAIPVAVCMAVCVAFGARADAPDSSRCPSVPATHPAGAERQTLREGEWLVHRDLPRLRALLPPEVWRLREVFFHREMRLEVGRCQRRYAPSDAFSAATRASAESARLDADGNLRGYRGGLPFPAERIDPEAADAGLRWAWNLELRHRGRFARGRFRLVDMPSRVGEVQTYEGDWFYFRAAPSGNPQAPPAADAGDYAFIAGGRFRAPQETRRLAWRQRRSAKARVDFRRPDDLFVFVPGLERVRRAAAAWVDGLYMPRYRVLRAADGSGDIRATDHLPRGFAGLALRPNAYRWRLLGERDVLAPLNVTRQGYPVERARRFGPSGLSAGDDRWDVRRAVVIQGAALRRDLDFDFLTVYVDRQTLQPLYRVTHRRGSHLVDVGVLLHRYSGDDRPDALDADGKPVRAFEPVAALFHHTGDGGSGWRRESYDLGLTPPDPGELERLLSLDALRHR